MDCPNIVQIIGAPVACADRVKDSWRETAEWAAGQLTYRFGDGVRVEYLDLFDTDCPTMPEGAQLPVALVEDRLISSGGKISIPLIRKSLEESGITPLVARTGM
jgi:disulfide oxidoreductase YuzD